MVGRGSERGNVARSATVIVASRWFLYYLTYIDDARSNTNHEYIYIYIYLFRISRLKLGNAYYYSVQNLLSSSLLSKNLKIKIY